MIDTLNDVCPHPCVQCGEPSYIGFNVPPLCTNRACHNFDQDTWADWVMAQPDDGDPPIGCTEPDFFDLDDEAKTDPYSYGIPFAGVPITGALSGNLVVPALGLPKTYPRHRDFCSSCRGVIEFTRRQDPVTGAFYAFCTQCGNPNVWL